MARTLSLPPLLLVVAWALLGAVILLPGPLAALGTRYSVLGTRVRDRLHHLSGVVAVPPSQMMAPRVIGARPLHPTPNTQHLSPNAYHPLSLPPLFGPNLDASLDDPSTQNETTIAISPDDSRRVITSANDYRAGLQPWVYLSTDAGANWVNYQVPGTESLYYGHPSIAFAA